MPESKPIRRIEYSPSVRIPYEFAAQTRKVFWEKFYDWSIYTPFTRKLARTYIPEFAAISEFPWRYAVDIYLEYKSFDIIVTPLALQLTWVFAAANGEIANKRILDLGCGSTGGTRESEEFPEHMFDPWLCRTLLELGACPIGVDVGELDKEKFEAHRKDLLQPGSLDFLPDDSIDIIHSSALHTSPQPGLENCEHLWEILNPQIARIIKPNGVFLFKRNY